MGSDKHLTGELTFDPRKPKEAAVAASSHLAMIADAVAASMTPKDAAMFHSTLLSRHLGYLAAKLGPDNVLLLLKVNASAMRDGAAEMREAIAARKRGKH